MKNVCKKLFSFLLAAVLLVSVVPFQAMADEAAATVPVKVFINGEYVSDKSFTLDAEGVVLDEAFALSLLRDTDGRKLDKWVDNVTGDVTGNTLRNNEWFQEQENYALELYLTEGTTPPPSTEAPSTEAPSTEAPSTEAPTEAPVTKNIVLKGLDGKVVSTIVITKGETVGALPTPDLVLNKRFTGHWYAEDGTELEAGKKVNQVSDFRDTYFAEYVEDDGSGDGLSVLHIKARMYSDGKYITVENVLSQVLPDGTHILKWLNDNTDRINGEIFSNSYANGYEWTTRYFYDYDNDAKLTEQSTINNGDKTVFVKLNATAAKSAKVLLYVHSKTSDSTPTIYEMTGYVKNGEVTQDNVMTVIKKHYSGSKMTLQGLYSDKTWKQLVGGENPTPVKTLTIDNNDLYVVHVILKNATSSSNSTADSSNPKTGDTIMMTVTVMAVSATALAAAYLLNKKRMAK